MKNFKFNGKNEGLFLKDIIFSYKKKCSYKNGKLHGLYNNFFHTNIIDKKCYYINGKKDGEYIEYFPNGDFMSKSYFKNNKEIYQIIFIIQ
jgi:antitoxin component YwqK of YwqJK toxin-antitoxin module